MTTNCQEAAAVPFALSVAPQARSRSAHVSTSFTTLTTLNASGNHLAGAASDHV
jgi:hypothetical protein